MFVIQEHSTVDKEFSVFGPEGCSFKIDYDDVDHPIVDLAVQEMVKTLNSHFDFDRFHKILDSIYDSRRMGEDNYVS